MTITGVYVAIIVKTDRFHYIDMGESQMVTTAKEQFTGQRMPPNCWRPCGKWPAAEGRDFETALEDAIRLYVECKTGNEVQPDAIAHFRYSLERNRRLYELLAQ